MTEMALPETTRLRIASKRELATGAFGLGQVEWEPA
jgi:hypothetical protein